MHAVVVLAFESCQLLDVSGPATVFAEAGVGSSRPPYRVRVGAAQAGAIATEAGVAIHADALGDLEATAPLTVIVPGANEAGLRRLLRDEHARAWTLRAAAAGARIASVCTGAFALAAWGLLDGRRATTHWLAADALARRFPGLDVDARALFIEDRGVWTSAGVSTGIDMALAMVERDLGRAAAIQVARRLVLQMRRPGGQSQFSAVLEAQAGAYAGLIDWVADHLDADLRLEALAARANEAPRTFHRRFAAETGTTPAAFVERLRLDRARSLLEAGTSAKRVAAAVGFGSLDRLGRAFKRAYDLTPGAYRALHGASSQAE